MANVEKKLILFLADPQFTKEELNKLHKLLSGNHVHSLFKKVQKIQSIIASDTHTSLNDLLDNNLNIYEKKILREVTLLLREEAGLTVKDSINALVETLKTNRPPPKRSFQDQLLFIIENRSGPEVINAAHQIRNLAIHNMGNSHWPLRDNE